MAINPKAFGPTDTPAVPQTRPAMSQRTGFGRLTQRAPELGGDVEAVRAMRQLPTFGGGLDRAASNRSDAKDRAFGVDAEELDFERVEESPEEVASSTPRRSGFNRLIASPRRAAQAGAPERPSELHEAFGAARSAAKGVRLADGGSDVLTRAFNPSTVQQGAIFSDAPRSALGGLTPRASAPSPGLEPLSVPTSEILGGAGPAPLTVPSSDIFDMGSGLDSLNNSGSFGQSLAAYAPYIMAALNIGQTATSDLPDHQKAVNSAADLAGAVAAPYTFGLSALGAQQFKQDYATLQQPGFTTAEKLGKIAVGSAIPMVGGPLIADKFFRPEIPHRIREELETGRAAAESNPMLQNVVRANSAQELWDAILPFQSGYVGGTEPRAVAVQLADVPLSRIANVKELVKAGRLSLNEDGTIGENVFGYAPGTNTVTAAVGRPNAMYPTVTDPTTFMDLFTPENMTARVQAGISESHAGRINDPVTRALVNRAEMIRALGPALDEIHAARPGQRYGLDDLVMSSRSGRGLDGLNEARVDRFGREMDNYLRDPSRITVLDDWLRPQMTGAGIGEAEINALLAAATRRNPASSAFSRYEPGYGEPGFVTQYIENGGGF